MNQSRIFTKRSMGIDNKVWLTMLTVVIICLGLMSYKIIARNTDKPCIPVTMLINGKENSIASSYNTNEPLLFRASTAPGSEVIWDFGDNTKKEEGFTTSHIYKKEGTFPITITINGKCPNYIKVNVIKPVPVIRDTAFRILQSITGPEQTIEGQPALFNSELTASTYEWSIVGKENIKPITTKEASFNFPLADTYIVQLTLDNDRMNRYTKTVVVVPDKSKELKVKIPSDKLPVLIDDPDKFKSKVENTPVAPPEKHDTVATAPVIEVKPMHKMISNKTLQTMLDEVVQGKKTVQDFDMFLCNGASTKLNGNGKITTFGAFCEMVIGNKKYRIESVEQGKENDCIATLTVNYKKKTFLGL